MHVSFYLVPSAMASKLIVSATCYIVVIFIINITQPSTTFYYVTVTYIVENMSFYKSYSMHVNFVVLKR